MKRLFRAGLWGFAGVMAMTAAARADPRLDEKVYDPYVEKHEVELETRWGQELGRGSLAGAHTLVVEGEYGLSDRASLALVGQIEREPDAPDRLVGLGLEGVAYLGRIPALGVDTGLYLEYQKGLHGEADEGEAKLLLAKRAGRFEGLVNLIAERPLNAPAGQGFASYGYAASATWRTMGELRLGAEAIGDFGDDHGFLSRAEGAYVGPQLKWRAKPGLLPVGVELDGGWLKSVGPARGEADSQARVALSFDRCF